MGKEVNGGDMQAVNVSWTVVVPPVYERQNLALAILILTADQINFDPLQCIAQIYQLICI
jgi:hypothetical protein